MNNIISNVLCLFDLLAQINLPSQLSFFKDVKKLLQQKLGGVKAKRVLREAVYLISIGGVDYSDFYLEFQNSTESLQLERVAAVLGNFSIILQVR